MKEYKVGDFLMHESAGVCQVSSIEERALSGKGSEKLYYALQPVYQDGSQVITPVEGAKVRIRDVKTKGEMESLLNRVDELDFIDEPNDRLRAERFKEEIAQFEPGPLAGVVKTVYLRKQMRIAAGKKVMASDEKVLQTAGKKLFEEMAFAMDWKLAEAQQAFFNKIAEVN